MAAWYADIPSRTAPPVLNPIPPKPPFTYTLGFSNDGSAIPSDMLWMVGDKGESEWENMIQCNAVADVESWSTVMLELVRHPERNSSNILRADILFDEVMAGEVTGCGGRSGSEIEVGQWTLRRRILRRLLPRRPGIDSHLDQLCSFMERKGPAGTSRLVIYLPLIHSLDDRRNGAIKALATIDAFLDNCSAVDTHEKVPFYHPGVKALAFEFHAKDVESANAASNSTNLLRISSLPFGSTPSPPTIQRICVSLLKTIHSHTWGVSHLYIPRVPQDRLVPKELYQDVYMNLKHRWASYLIREWREGTDPEKHVHEDLALTAWLMCFWRIRFGEGVVREEVVKVGLQERPWFLDSQHWPRPPGGFVDVGCGNGLLVWLLNNEGYTGHGFDLRPRKSWELFHSKTILTVPDEEASERADPIRPADLRVQTLDAIRLIQDLLDESLSGENTQESSLFPPGCFLIGNHADELTPILPLLSTALPDCSGILNIPCCAWSIEGGRFNKCKYTVTREEVASLLEVSLSDIAPTEEGKELLRSQMLELGLGPPVDGSSKSKASKSGASAVDLSTPAGSRNIAYLSYISHLHLLCGWLVEKEALRMPSTKNWGVVSTQRVGTREKSRERARVLIYGVGDKWKARDVEGEGRWFLKTCHDE